MTYLHDLPSSSEARATPSVVVAALHPSAPGEVGDCGGGDGVSARSAVAAQSSRASHNSCSVPHATHAAPSHCSIVGPNLGPKSPKFAEEVGECAVGDAPANSRPIFAEPPSGESGGCELGDSAICARNSPSWSRRREMRAMRRHRVSTRWTVSASCAAKWDLIKTDCGVITT